ncbi:hypothetical protein V2J09_017457 [Rumex salicifolius]
MCVVFIHEGIFAIRLKYFPLHWHRNVVPQEATSLPINEDNDQGIVNDVIEATKQISYPPMSKPKGRPREIHLKDGKELKRKQNIDEASQLQRPQKRKKNVESAESSNLIFYFKV